jgi:hypothetical protein
MNGVSYYGAPWLFNNDNEYDQSDLSQERDGASKEFTTSLYFTLLNLTLLNSSLLCYLLTSRHTTSRHSTLSLD